MIEAYPLHWPEGWKRENGRHCSKFNTSGSKAHDHLVAEVVRMGGKSLIVSTNVPLRQDGKMRMDREPVDPGVAVYFTRNGKQVVFACDRFDLLRDNMLSIAKTIEALRGIERWGASEMMERAFTGFKALSDASQESWWDVLECRPDAPEEIIQAQYRSRVRVSHPDTGGSEEAMQRLNVARDQALASIRGSA
jgi:hypothetical protein